MTFFFLLLVLIGVMFPSDGSHGLLNPKSLGFIALAGSWGASLVIRPKFTPKDQGLLIAFLAILSGIFFFSVLGLGNEESMVAQAKLFIITASVPFALCYLVEGKKLSFSTFVKTALWGNAFYSLIKLSLVLLHVLGVINLLDLMEKLGLRYMSMEVLGGLGRMQTSVDILTPFLLYFALSYKTWGVKLSQTFLRLYVPLAWLSIALSFSRFFLACGFMAHVMVWISKKEIPLAVSLLKALVIGGLLVTAAGPDRVYKVVEKRFFSDESSKSDSVRQDQMVAMNEKFEENPLFGAGMGGYSEKLYRDKKLKYSYEVQWMAFLMQFGIVGIFLILTLLAYLAYLILKPPVTLAYLGLFGMYVLWLAAGLTNPFLISLPSGIMYALFLGAASFSRPKDSGLSVTRNFN